jgi:hypothetical protein
MASIVTSVIKGSEEPADPNHQQSASTTLRRKEGQPTYFMTATASKRKLIPETGCIGPV